LGSNGEGIDQKRMTFVAFSATTRMSGVDFDARVIRKGADDAMGRWSEKDLPADVRARVDAIGRSGGTPLVVGENKIVLGTIHLKDIVKPNIRDRFAELRRMGLRTVMITGD